MPLMVSMNTINGVNLYVKKDVSGLYFVCLDTFFEGSECK